MIGQKKVGAVMDIQQSKDVADKSLERFDKRPYRNLLVTVAAILLGSFVVLMINQAAQLINLAMMVHPIFGKGLFVFFVLLVLGTFIWTIILITGLEKPLEIPDEHDTEAYARYLSRLKKRLMNNHHLKTQAFEWTPDKDDIDLIQSALVILDEEGKQIVRRQAATVFVTTAVSQNGSLDSLFVFVTVLKLVWRISMLYHQRPAIRDLVKLYANIFGTVLLSRQIDDLDLIAEQLEPVLTTLFGGTLGNIVPGVSYVVSFVADSIFEGSLNTLLTLRVGLIAQMYCRSITRIEPRQISKTATVQACALLGTIISQNSRKITQSIIRAIKRAGVHTYNQSKSRFSDTIEKMFRKGGKESAPE